MIWNVRLIYLIMVGDNSVAERNKDATGERSDRSEIRSREANKCINFRRPLRKILVSVSVPGCSKFMSVFLSGDHRTRDSFLHSFFFFIPPTTRLFSSVRACTPPCPSPFFSPSQQKFWARVSGRVKIAAVCLTALRTWFIAYGKMRLGT